MPDSPRAADPLRIVVLGAGFAGLGFARRLKTKLSHDGRPVQITLIDKQNHHLFQPLLYQVATAALAAPEIAEPLRSVFRRQKNVNIVMDEIESIDLDGQKVHGRLQDHGFDYLVLALGGRTSYFGHDEWAEHATGLKSLADAMKIRKQMLTVFERAELTDDPDERRRLMRTVVVGGGPTGVELAGAMADLTREVWHKDFRNIDISDAQVLLVDFADRVLGVYPEKLSAAAQKQLEGMGVEVRLNTKVVDIQSHRVWLEGPDGETVDYRAGTILWGGGVLAAEVLNTLGVNQDRAGRVVVEPDLSVPGYSNVFCLGDAASVLDQDGKPVPGVAPAAMQMGHFAANLLRQELQGELKPKDRPKFQYLDKGSMAIIGRSKAVAHLYNKIPLTGFSAWMAWLLIHLLFLVGFRNKLVTLIQWIYHYITFRSGARVIVEPSRSEEDDYANLRTTPTSKAG